MDRVREKMQKLRIDAEEATAKSEELQARVRVLDQESLAKDQEIASLQHKNGVLEEQLEKLTATVKDLEKTANEGSGHSTQNETLVRRLELLEQEAEESDKTLRDANEKFRQADINAGHFARKVQALEAEREQWEKKYEEMATKYETIRKELEEFQLEIGSI